MSGPAAGAGAGRRPMTVITGGSDGIGLALARHFIRDERPLVLIGRDPVKLAAARSALGALSRVEVLTLALDLTDADAVAVLADTLARADGYCDVLVNCAGIGLAGDFLSHSADALSQLVDLNVRALTVLTRHFLPEMVRRKRGGVLNVASLGGYGPGPYQAAYYASKAYVISLTEALAHEYRGYGVHIGVVAPGPVRTAFHRRMGGESGFYLRLLPVASPDRVARSIYWRFRLGQRVIIPGFLNPVMMLGMRLLPHRLLVPMIGFLLKPRGGDQV